MSIISPHLPNCPECKSRFVGVANSPNNHDYLDHTCMDCECAWTTINPPSDHEKVVRAVLARWLGNEPPEAYDDDLDELVAAVLDSLHIPHRIARRTVPDAHELASEILPLAADDAGVGRS